MQLTLLLLVSAFSGLTSLDNTLWNQYMGPNQNGTITGTGVFKDKPQPNLKVRWVRDLGSGYSEISSDESNLYAMYEQDGRDWLEAMEAATGKSHWRYEMGATYKGHEGSADGPLSTPLIDGGKVYGLGPFGALFALDKNTGREIWRVELADLYEAAHPKWGFTTSPIMAHGRLIVQIGGPKRSLGAFNPKTGALEWTSGEEGITYQSPTLLKLAGQTWLISNTDTHVKGLDPKTGRVLWSQLISEEGISAISRITRLGNDRFLVGQKGYLGSYAAYKLSQSKGQWQTSELWTERNFNGYQSPIYFEDHVYGVSRGILTCVNAETGERVWRSREPGQSNRFIMVDQHLISWLSDGRLHIGKVSGDGYRDLSGAKVLKTAGFTQPTFAHGRVYVRNLWKLAAVDIVSQRSVAANGETGSKANSRFTAFLEELETATDKKNLVDVFFQKTPHTPLLEGGMVHFLYRGPAKDVAVASPFNRSGEPMTQAVGTDLFYKSYPVEEGSRLEYQFITDFDTRIADPLNPRKAPTSRPNTSELVSPQWQDPDWLLAQDPELDEWEFKSEIAENERTIKVYLPEGYEDGNQRYPLLLVNHGDQALEHGLTARALSRITPGTAAPAVVVFVPFHKGPYGIYGESSGPKRLLYGEMLVKELLPHLQKTYRLKDHRDARMLMGSGVGGNASLMIALKHPDLFSAVAAQGVAPGPHLRRDLLENMDGDFKLKVWLDRCIYDSGNVMTDNDYLKDHKMLSKALTKHGHQLSVHNITAGSGWGAWRSRTGDLLQALLPVK